MVQVERNETDAEHRYRSDDLIRFAREALEAAGLRKAHAQQVAFRLIDADLLGHASHGISLLPTYLERLAAGKIARDGEITVMSDTASAFSWHAHRLPGAWVMHRALEEVSRRAENQAIVVATIAECSHIGCLQSYLLTMMEQNLFVMLSATNAGVASVAPFGGIDPVITTNPIAFGIPTRGTPILVDQCTSLGSNFFFSGFAQRGESLPAPWLLDAEGQPSTDPSVLTADSRGTILPLGGLDFGYKGFGLGLAVEALTLALPGSGRRSHPDRFGQGVFLQVLNPRFLGGLDAFLDETTYLADACHASRVPEGKPPVRLPGERALSMRKAYIAEGIPLSRAITKQLAERAAEFRIAMPTSA